MQNSLLKPKSIYVEQISANRGKVVLEPFERGYGHTLGNALRRVLLSSMQGFAPTEVTIAGVVHEYSSIDGAHEDVVNILLNLKGVVFKLHNRDEVTLCLRKDTEGVVRASDIQTPHDVEIINPDHVVANLAHGGKLDMQIKVESGRGYVPGTMRRHTDEPTKSIGRIVLDASFSPVKRVSYTVESARVEQRTDLDKLILDIETNGVISAEDAVRASAKILIEQLAVFAQLEGGEEQRMPALVRFNPAASASAWAKDKHNASGPPAASNSASSCWVTLGALVAGWVAAVVMFAVAVAVATSSKGARLSESLCWRGTLTTQAGQRRPRRMYQVVGRAGLEPATKGFRFVPISGLPGLCLRRGPCSLYDPEFKGFAFINASVEFPQSENPVHQTSMESARTLRNTLASLARESGIKNADTLALQLALVIEGTAITERTQRGTGAVEHAKALAKVLINSIS